jgi:hypothetical protein
MDTSRLWPLEVVMTVAEERLVLYHLAGTNTWVCKSRSQDGYWMLAQRPEGGVACGCPGFQYRHDCAHARALQRRLRRDGERRRRQAMRERPDADEIRAAWSDALPDLDFSEVDIGDG